MATVPYSHPYEHQQREDDPRNVLACVAMRILLCPCHEGAQRDIEQLTEFQREQMWYDLTGQEEQTQQSITMDEPHCMIEDCLIRLEQELETIADKGAYETALKMYPSYVKDRKFLLKFLRAEKFDCHLAAQRLVRHFEEKLLLFGEELLGREILLSDLSADGDMDSFKSGFLQVLPTLDISGRKIVFYYKAITGCYKYRSNILRTAWYIFNSLSQDESVQKRGIVNVVYNNGGYPEGGMDYEKSRRFAKIIRAVPIRFDSFFVCLDEAPWLNVVEAFSVMVDKFLRIRMRVLFGENFPCLMTWQVDWWTLLDWICSTKQYDLLSLSTCMHNYTGSHQECMYQLLALGVSYRDLPVNARSELLVHNHLEWYKLRKRKESQIEEYAKMVNNLQGGWTCADPYSISDLLSSTKDFYGF